MSRRGQISKRDVLPDPMYNSKTVTKLINKNEEVINNVADCFVGRFGILVAADSKSLEERVKSVVECVATLKHDSFDVEGEIFAAENEAEKLFKRKKKFEKCADEGILVGLIDNCIVIKDENENEMKFPADQVSKTCLAVVF